MTLNFLTALIRETVGWVERATHPKTRIVDRPAVFQGSTRCGNKRSETQQDTFSKLTLELNRCQMLVYMVLGFTEFLRRYGAMLNFR